jgi:starch synthase (maltosyl-transferring)
MIGRIPITDPSPVVSAGRWPARAVAGETLAFAATIFRDGHDALGANLVLQRPSGGRIPFVRLHPHNDGTDRFSGSALLDEPGLWRYKIEAWSDPIGTWRHAIEVKVGAGQDATELAVDLEDGALLFEEASKGLPKAVRPTVAAAVKALRDTSLVLADRIAPALAPELAAELDEKPLRQLVTADGPYGIKVDRVRALFGSWYELFPRSEGSSLDPPRSGTLRTAAERLAAVAEMGFDVVYLPPISPVGEVNRKGPNNTLTAGPDDPGSPWAIGSRLGGHDAVHPDLGTLADFDAFVAAARALGMEVALDLALQCAPDHPWAAKHPEWFHVKSDGSIAYAENPPKKYQDIYPINFDTDPEGIYAAVLEVVRHWMEHGVRIFRVDNPHTKPVAFWERLIAEIQATDPDVLFLAEAFTRPPMMHALAKVGFTQSYTYFTWRNSKDELQEYLTELTRESADFMRPNFFVNTPDILPAYLQYGGPAAFKIRAVLAALLSPSWGVYSGYELFEHVAVKPGSEEYLDSEKYQYRPRDWAAAEKEGRSLAPFLTLLNRVRREHPALQWLRNLTFHGTDSPEVIAFSKSLPTEDGLDSIIAVVNLDPHATRETTVYLDMSMLGAQWGSALDVHDEITGASFQWGESNYVRLDPFDEPAHLLTVRGVS